MAAIEIFRCACGHEDTDGIFHVGERSSVKNGIGASIAFYNCSGKEIKYIKFTFVPYNSVNDVCDEAETAELTGPIQTNRGVTVSFDPLWFNATLVRIELEEVNIVYMDNSSEKLKGADVVNVFDKNRKFTSTEDVLYAKFFHDSIHDNDDSGYVTFFDDNNRAREYISGFYSFNVESTFYKNYKDAWIKSIEKYNEFVKKENKKDKIKSIIKWVIISGIVAYAISLVVSSFK